MPKPDLRNPIEHFVASCMTHYLKCKVPEFHRDMYQHLSEEWERLVFEAPRDFAKSTLACVLFALYLICKTDLEDLQLFSQSGGTGGLSTKWLTKIKKEIETNAAMRVLYGVQRGGAWGQDHIEILRPDGRPPINVYSKGKKSAARGGRGYVIIDDPQNKADVRSGTVLEADEQWFYEDVVNILEPGQRCIFIGSRLSPLSLLSKVARTPGWKLLSYKAITDGKSIWPEKWPLHELEKRRDEIGVDNFNSEFQNQPRISDNPIFREDWFQYYEQDSANFQDITNQGLYTVASCDPAISKRETADYTAIITYSKTFEAVPRYFIRDVKKFRGTLRETAQQVMVTFDQFQQNKTVAETVGAFVALADEIREQERIEGKHVNLVTVSPQKDKAARAFSVQGLFQTGRVYFDTTQRAQQELIDELLMFTGDPNSLWPDDQVDALVHGLIEGNQHTHARDSMGQGASTKAMPVGYGFQHATTGGRRI